MAGLNVIVIGAGLGGLCLAQGLRRAGIEVAVYERDPSPYARGQGYRIHLGPDGNAALRECLPPDTYRLYTATCGRMTDDRPVLLDQWLVSLADADYTRRYASGDLTGHSIVDRLAFRQALTAGLTDVIYYGRAGARFAQTPQGRVVAHFADGGQVEGDVLVGADGAGSTVRRRYLPAAEPFDSGLRVIYGKAPLTDDLREALPRTVVEGFAIVAGPNRRSMALGGYEFREDPARVATELGFDIEFRETDDYLMWALGCPAGELPGGSAADAEALAATALDLTDGWHPAVRDAITASVPHSRRFLNVHSSAPVAAWPTSNVTLIGDAAHTMYPAGGATQVALRDAHLLVQALSAVADGTTPLLRAIGEYESAMHAYAWSAVRASYHMAERMGAVPWATAVSGPDRLSPAGTGLR